MKHNSRTIWNWLCTTILVLLRSLLSAVAAILVSQAATPYGSSMLTIHGGGAVADGSDGITLTFNVTTYGAAQIRSRGKNYYYLSGALILYKYLNKNVFVTYL